MGWPALPRRTAQDDDGSALVFTLMVATVLGAVGLSYAVLAEREVRASLLWQDRQRSQLAARDVLEVAGAWFSAPASGHPLLPPPEAWTLSERRGDREGDGEVDAECDGSTASGQLGAWREAGASHPFAPDVFEATARALCGTPQAPDLLLEGGDYLLELSRTLGENVVIERVTISAAPTVEGRPSGLAHVTCDVAIRRESFLGNRTHAEANVLLWPLEPSEEVILAGDDITLLARSEVHWGAVEAAGDIHLPPPGVPGFPASGLPRGNDGRRPIDIAPGGAVDWNLATTFRECVLTELLGETRRGVFVSRRPDPPPVPDPWLSLRAGREFVFEPPVRHDPRTITDRHPWPHDPASTPLPEDRSHLSRQPAREDPLGEGGLRDLVAAAEGGGSRGPGGVRRFVLVQDGAERGEPLWREDGEGPARSASSWLGGPGGAAAISIFVAPEDARPPRVTLEGGRGIVLVDAREVVLRPGAFAVAATPVNLPGEPFLDVGIDVDGDRHVEPTTAGNARWDLDGDGDERPDEDPTHASFALEVSHAGMASGYLPHWDQDERYLGITPHEPFLNLAYPSSTDDLSCRVDFLAGRADTGQVVDEEPPPPGQDLPTVRRTTMACDAVGPRLELPVHLHGLLINVGGDVRVESGFRVHGALRVTGAVTVAADARVTFDAALARDGWPAVPGLRRTRLEDIAVGRGATLGRPRLVEAAAPAADTGGEDAADEVDDDLGAPDLHGAAPSDDRGSPDPTPGRGQASERGGPQQRRR
jgi:hypothetical protein